MKAVYIKVPYQFKTVDVQLRDVQADDVLVDVKACGICGSEMMFGGWKAEDWTAIGHEVAGVVEKVGSNVTHVKVGDKVILMTGAYCGLCEDCRNGRQDLCNRARNMFAEESIGFAEKIIVNKQCVVPLKDGIPFDEASVIEPMGVSMDLFNTTGIELNDDVLVVGLGPIGLMALRFARLAGARKIYAAEFSGNTKRLEVAKMYGANEIICTDKVNLADYKFARGGVEKVMVTAPPKVVASTIPVTLNGGTIAYLGYGHGDDAYITFEGNAFHENKLSLKASYAAPALWFPRCMDLMLEGMIDVKPLITHRVKLEDIESAVLNVRDNRAQTIKSVMIND